MTRFDLTAPANRNGDRMTPYGLKPRVFGLKRVLSLVSLVIVFEGVG